MFLNAITFLCLLDEIIKTLLLNSNLLSNTSIESQNKDAASVTGCLLKNFRLACLKSYLKCFKHLKKHP